MITVNQIASFIFVATALVGCSPSKKMMRDADILRDGGLTQQAFEKYNQVYADYKKPEALVGMRAIAQQELNKKYGTAQQLCLSENYEAALREFDNAVAYQQQHRHLELTTPAGANEKNSECKRQYIASLLKKAEELVFAGSYDQARLTLNKVYALDRNNEQARYMEMICDIMPNYLAGKKALEMNLYRDGYTYFNEVCKIDASFRDAKALRDECLAMGAFSIVYTVKSNRNAPTALDKLIASTIKGEILKLNNPFIEILERDNLDVVFEEQQNSLRPEFNTEDGPGLGKLKTANYILSGELIQYKMETSPELRTKCDCASNLRIFSDKVTCFEVKQNRKISASFKYQLIDAESGKLHISDVVTFSQTDDAKRYDYEIQRKISLVSPTLSREHDVDLSQMKIPAADPLLSEEELNKQLSQHLSVKVAQQINSFKK